MKTWPIAFGFRKISQWWASKTLIFNLYSFLASQEECISPEECTTSLNKIPIKALETMPERRTHHWEKYWQLRVLRFHFQEQWLRWLRMTVLLQKTTRRLNIIHRATTWKYWRVTRSKWPPVKNASSAWGRHKGTTAAGLICPDFSPGLREACGALRGSGGVGVGGVMAILGNMLIVYHINMIMKIHISKFVRCRQNRVYREIQNFKCLCGKRKKGLKLNDLSFYFKKLQKEE